MKAVKICGKSDIGRVREKNEDSFGVFSFPDMTVGVVADGMGGHLGGKVASETAVQAVRNLFERNRNRLPVAEILEDALELANRTIGEKSRAEFENLKIGTTCTVVAVTAPEKDKSRTFGASPFTGHFAHLGDSRLYLIRDGSISQMSTDHTMLQKMLQAGALSPAEAEHYPHKNIIYKSLDGSEGLEIDPVQTLPLHKGDVLVLCSDGLSNYVKPDEILRVVMGTKTIRVAADHLVHTANARGGDDNITVVVLECGSLKRDRSIRLEPVRPPRRPGEKLKAPGHSRGRKMGISALLGALVVALGLLVLQITDFRKAPQAPASVETGEPETPVSETEPVVEPERIEDTEYLDHPEPTDDRSVEAVAADNAAWAFASGLGTEDALRKYLRDYPSGRYVEEARAKLDALSVLPLDAMRREEMRRAEEEKRRKAEEAERRQKAEEAERQRKTEEAKRAAAPKAGDVWREPMTGMEFVWIPPGEFMMGSKSGLKDEKPVHRVRITKGFWMGKYEVTQGQWQKIMRNNPSQFKKTGNSPVEQVSWNDAQDFIRRLNSRTGQSFRLPTEAEWEYACRAGTTGERYGDIDAIAWYDGNSGGSTQPVGRKRPNAFGLYDMLGNVWEWVQDWYDSGYYARSPVDDPQGPSSGSGRIYRGGSCIDDQKSIRSARREIRPPSDGSYVLGFRLVRGD